MTLIRIAPPWQISENNVTAESIYFQRRQFLKGLLGASIGGSLLTLTGCQTTVSQTPLEKTLNLPKFNNLRKNPNFNVSDRPITAEKLAGQYNNFYEFGGTKDIWMNAQKLPTQPWQVKVAGLVKYPKTYDLDTLIQTFPIEERIYRFRCVEAWSMVLPWVGFPMKALIKAVEPTSQAKFVRFTSFYDPKITTGPSFHLGKLPWPYQEALRIEEMANDLAFFAVGIYGHRLPKQHGAPLRMVIPWKYGFKGAKSIVKIEFLDKQPATYWNILAPNEYGFEANVNPNKPHPRWSQATERFIGQGDSLSWKIKETMPFNGYGKYVASLY